MVTEERASSKLPETPAHSGPAIRVLYVEPFYWSCGPHNVLRNLISGIDRDEFSPHVVMPRHSGASSDFSGLDVPVERLKAIHNLGRKGGAPSIAAGALKTVFGAAQVAMFARAHSIDVIHTNNETCLSGSLAARLAGLPSVIHVHGLGFAASRTMGGLVARILNATADRVIAVSSVVANALESHGVRPDKIRVVHNGIDTGVFHPGIDSGHLRGEFGLSDDQPTVGMIGGIEPRKGHDLFLRAAAEVRKSYPQTSFFIIGATAPGDSERYQQKLRRLIHALDLEEAVVFTGARNNIPELLSMLDVVVQPSKTEAGPLVPLESMSAGKPIVVTDVGGNPEEVLHQQTGLVVSPNDPRKLAEAVSDLLIDASLRERLGAAGRSHVKANFSIEAMSSKMETIYREISCAGRKATVNDRVQDGQR